MLTGVREEHRSTSGYGIQVLVDTRVMGAPMKKLEQLGIVAKVGFSGAILHGARPWMGSSSWPVLSLHCRRVSQNRPTMLWKSLTAKTITVEENSVLLAFVPGADRLARLPCAAHIAG